MTRDAAGAGALVDLHLHSTASDGTLPPAEVVRRAAAAGLAGLALTDHDTVDGIAEAAREADALGLAFLPAAELSANEPGRSVHLLAYGIDPTDGELQAFLSRFREDRLRRAREMVERLRALGLELEYAAVEREAGEAAPTRAHVARALVRERLVGSHEAVFRRWLSRGRPGFVEKRPTPPGEVMRRVRAAGGVTLLAHPGRTHGEDVIRRWVSEGLDGVEVRHPDNPPDVRARLEALVRELGLLRAGGSDWHGPAARRPEPGSEEVPMEWMEEIVARSGTTVYQGSRRPPGGGDAEGAQP